MTRMSDLAQSDRATIADRLKQVRKSLNLGQAEMASRLGLSLQTYGRGERGAREISAKFLIGLIHLGFSADWVLIGRGDMQIDGAQSTSPSLTEIDLALRLARCSVTDKELREVVTDLSATGSDFQQMFITWFEGRPRFEPFDWLVLLVYAVGFMSSEQRGGQ